MRVDDKLIALRKQMMDNNIDAYIIPSSDPHLSEYVADCWETRKWISGFTGSAGIVVVTQNHAGLWTDSRYFLQAEDEFADNSFELHKVIQQSAPMHEDWICEHLNERNVVGFDQLMFSASQVERMKKKFESNGLLIDADHDLAAFIWKDRPPIPQHEIFTHDLKYAGISTKEKLKKVRTEMHEKGANHYLVTTLDDIAWLCNARGSDVVFNPVFIAYVIVSDSEAQLFVHEGKLNSELKESLLKDGFQIKNYEHIDQTLSQISSKELILVNKGSCNARLYNLIQSDSILNGDNIIMNLKAIKNDTEISHFRHVMKKDAVALCQLYMWVEEQLTSGTVSEAEVAKKLAAFRSQKGDYFGESFSAIVGFESNGAIVHYRPEEEKCAQINNTGMLLLDSGGQYQDGTTDITRTVHFGKPSEEQRRNYTNVLKGHISLARARFPKGTTGGQLDILARQHLWKTGLNYLHGTGHGVGFFLNVHEPPQGFAPGNSGRAKTTLKAGMVISNEPGFYLDGSYGIRIENLVLTIESEFDGFLEFETITYFPIATNLIIREEMNVEEIEWLNNYHSEVLNSVASLLDKNQLAWMKEKCALI